jgi:hypothetical protein
MLVGGTAALAYLIYDYLQYKMRLRLRRDEVEQGAQRFVSYDWKVYAMIILTLVIAYLYARPIERPIFQVAPGSDIEVPTEAQHAYIVAFYIFVIGVVWAIRQAGKTNISRRALINTQVTDLIHQFRSVFRIRPTVFSALEEANRKMLPPVGTAVAHAVTTFYVTSLPRRAFDELRHRIENPYMEQFVYILERGEDAKHEDILEALEGLLKRLRSAREIRDQSEVNMTVITGQTRIIQLIAITLVLVVAAVPGLRIAYESVPGQILFLVIATVGVTTSWFIDRAATNLKERVL